jgi:hypothetical protein
VTSKSRSKKGCRIGKAALVHSIVRASVATHDPRPARAGISVVACLEQQNGSARSCGSWIGSGDGRTPSSDTRSCSLWKEHRGGHVPATVPRSRLSTRFDRRGVSRKLDSHSVRWTHTTIRFACTAGARAKLTIPCVGSSSPRCGPGTLCRSYPTRRSTRLLHFTAVGALFILNAAIAIFQSANLVWA